tara:strand:+ start:243 stop:623 length:381 start_codon:yes stop_codon:yes gene_type:complete
MNKRYQRYIDYIIKDLMDSNVKSYYFYVLENRYGINKKEYPIIINNMFNNVTEWEGDLDISYLPIKTLGNLKRVTGNLDCYNSDLETLSKLEFVGGWLNLVGTPVSKSVKYIGVDPKMKVNEKIYI